MTGAGGMTLPAWWIPAILAIMLALTAWGAWAAYRWGRADGRLDERTISHERELQARTLEADRARWLTEYRRAENDAAPLPAGSNRGGRQPWPTTETERVPEWTPSPAPIPGPRHVRRGSPRQSSPLP